MGIRRDDEMERGEEAEKETRKGKGQTKREKEFVEEHSRASIPRAL